MDAFQLEQEHKISQLMGELCSASAAAGVPVHVGRRFTHAVRAAAVTRLRLRGWRFQAVDGGDDLALRVLQEGKL